MFGLFKKKNEAKEEKPKRNIIEVELIDCDDNRGNLYYDVVSDSFFDFIIPYREHWLAVEQEVFDDHILVMGSDYYPGNMDKCRCCRRKTDIRDLKVLDESIIRNKFLKDVNDNNRLLLKDGFITIDNCLLQCSEYYYSELKLVGYPFKYWEVNGQYTLTRIFNSLQQEQRDDYIENYLRPLEYKMKNT